MTDYSYEYGLRASGETHGVVLTKPHIVELILDLAGYTEQRDLASLQFLEPACGQGAFVLPAVHRLLRSAKQHNRSIDTLDSSVLAIDVAPSQVEQTRSKLAALLRKEGIPSRIAQRLLKKWIVCGDFLLLPLSAPFDVIVGNPPYIRIEQIPPRLLAAYRARYASLYDRADLYVACIERALSLLHPRGVLSFICADRWTRNRYGAPLRRLISERYTVQWYLDLSQTSPFDSEVSAYPAIFAISPKTHQESDYPTEIQSKSVQVLTLQSASAEECRQAAALVRRDSSLQMVEDSGPPLKRYDSWFVGDEPWLIGEPSQLRLLRQLEREHPRLEECGGVQIGIGVATGSDAVYLLDRQRAKQLESDRVLPLVMRQDLWLGAVRDSGRYVVNTFTPNGQPVSLTDHPRLRDYLLQHEESLRQRHIAKRNPASWFRTIDRVYPELTHTPKLLIPDIAGALQVTFDPGHYYPHHNLYFVTAEQADLEVLGGLLSSRVALFFVWSYAVKMRGGYLRFQAQYLRRIRVPQLNQLSPELQDSLRSAFRRRDFATLDALALRAYRIDQLPTFDFLDTRR
jgi:hypothetical protein